jgi:predicted transcriptional regulator
VRDKRNRFEIYGDILRAIGEEISRNGVARMTRLHLKSNVPYDRLKEYVREMDERGLVSVTVAADGHREVRTTARGIQLLKEYIRVREFLIGFGLAERDNST